MTRVKHHLDQSLRTRHGRRDTFHKLIGDRAASGGVGGTTFHELIGDRAASGGAPEGRCADRVAFIDAPTGASLSYAALAERAERGPG